MLALPARRVALSPLVALAPLARVAALLGMQRRRSRARRGAARGGGQKGTKTESVKHIPVHPTLAAMLAEWKFGGWAAMMVRHPEPDDLIVPLPPDAAARRRTRTGDPYRGHDYSGDRWRLEDLPALGWRHRRHYDMRTTFITLALEDGADPHLIETRVTHTRKKRSAFEGYNRGLQWDRTCAEVAKLKIARRPAGRGEVIALPIAAGAEGTETTAEAAEDAADGASRYSARYSPRKDEGSHAKILPHAPLPGARMVLARSLGA